VLTNNNFVVPSLICFSGLILREWAVGFSEPVQSGSSEAGADGHQHHAGAKPGPEQEGPQVHTANQGLMPYEQC